MEESLILMEWKLVWLMVILENCINSLMDLQVGKMFLNENCCEFE